MEKGTHLYFVPGDGELVKMKLLKYSCTKWARSESGVSDLVWVWTLVAPMLSIAAIACVLGPLSGGQPFTAPMIVLVVLGAAPLVIWSLWAHWDVTARLRFVLSQNASIFREQFHAIVRRNPGYLLVDCYQPGDIKDIDVIEQDLDGHYNMVVAFLRQLETSGALDLLADENSRAAIEPDVRRAIEDFVKRLHLAIEQDAAEQRQKDRDKQEAARSGREAISKLLDQRVASVCSSLEALEREE